MTKAVALDDTLESGPTPTDMYLIAMPLATYRLLSDAATKRNLTFAEALSQALTQWAVGPTKLQLLMETKE